MSQVVLITGCSSGIGRELAESLSRAGYSVAATARKVETLAGLPAALKLPLDVTSAGSIKEAVDCTLRRFGRIDVLINNAGYAVRGAVEEVPVEQAQEMFDANLFGVMRMVRAVLPSMRERRGGRIINISSVSGKLVTPANGAYSASKFALEGLSDALRLELLPFGIQVVLIEPGSIKTQFHATVQAEAQDIFADPGSPYQSLYRQYEQVNAEMRRAEPGPEAVSPVVLQAIKSPRPKPRYLAAFPFPGALVLLLRDSIWDLALRRMFKISAPQPIK
jgi:NAD(P)-dependent dehydrogenase (short-subunit alcohol dehydrogenase family)